MEAHNYALKKPNSAMENETVLMERMKNRIAVSYLHIYVSYATIVRSVINKH